MFEFVVSQHPGYVDLSHVSSSLILPAGITPIVVHGPSYSNKRLLKKVYRIVPEIQQMSTTVVIKQNSEEGEEQALEELIEANGWGWTVVKRKDIVGCEDEAIIVLQGRVTPEVVSRARTMLVLVNTWPDSDLPPEKTRRINLEDL